MARSFTDILLGIPDLSKEAQEKAYADLVRREREEIKKRNKRIRSERKLKSKQ